MARFNRLLLTLAFLLAAAPVLAEDRYTLPIATGMASDFALPGLSQPQCAELASDAAQEWEKACGVRFMRKSDYKSQATPSVIFEARPLPAGTRARTTPVFAVGLPVYAGRVQFDSSHVWTPSEFYATCLHELGHVVGLAHSGSPADVMYEFSTATRFSPSDVLAARAIHGPPERKVAK